MMKTPSQTRNIYLDIIRGMAVFFVLWGHSIQHFCTNDIDFFENTVFRFIYSFHMPLFMLLSGYFFYFSIQKHNIISLILNRLRTLVIPILSWGIIITISEGYFSHNISYEQFVYHAQNIWFLWAVLIASFIVGITHIALKKFKWNPIVHIAIFMLLFLSQNRFPMLQEYRTIYVYPYFILGFLYNEYKDKIPAAIKYLRYLSIPLYIVLFPYFHTKEYIYTTKIDIYQSPLGMTTQLKIDIFRWVIGLVGSLLILVIVELLIKSKYISIVLNLLFSKLGTISLQVYVVQRVLLECFANHFYQALVAQSGRNFLLSNITLYNLYWTPLIAVLFALLIYWLVKLLSLIKPLKFILFGGR